MTITTMTSKTPIITNINTIHPFNYPKLTTKDKNPKIKSKTIHNLTNKTMIKTSNNPNKNQTKNPSKKLTNLLNTKRKTTKTNKQLILIQIIPYQNQDQTLIKNCPSPTSKIATFKLSPNTSLILTLNSHIHVNKSSNSLLKKSTVSIKNSELTLKKSMINLLNSSIKT